MRTLVAGPIDILPMDPLEGAVTFAQRIGLWVDRLGLIVRADSGDFTNWVYAVQLDGSAVRLTNRRTTIGWGWDPAARLPAWSHSGLVDPGWRRVRMPATAELGDLAATQANSFGVLPDRVITFSAAGHMRILSGDYATAIPGTFEYEFPGAPTSSSLGIIAFAGEHAGHLWWYCLSPLDGRIYLYDSTDRTEIPNSRTSLGAAFRTAGYSAKHDLFFCIRRSGGTDQMYVYANEPVADSISDPAFASGPRRGAVTTLSATVLGDLDEPCPDRNVTFAVTAGSVDPAVAATDADGIATTTYRAPFAASTGETATATLDD